MGYHEEVSKHAVIISGPLPCNITCSSRRKKEGVFLHFALPQIRKSIKPTKARERKRENKRRLLMECVFGLVGDGFAIIASDTSAVHSILVHKSNEDKVMILDSHKLMGASGESGDRVNFTEYIQKNVALYQFRNGIPLTTAAAANFTRGELATALRKDTRPLLYFIDYIATLHKVDKAAFGCGSYFALSIMDRHYYHGMFLEEAINLVDKCIMEIRSRLVVAPPNFVIKIVDEKGAREYAWREFIKDAASGLPAA